MQLVAEQRVKSRGRMPVTPEAAGSSPVDPANYPSESKAFPLFRLHRLARVAGGRGLANLQGGEISGQTGLDFRHSVLPRIAEILAFLTRTVSPAV